MSSDQQTQPTSFDLQVTHREEKTGLVTQSNPYTLRVIASADGGKMRIYERPVGSGNLWNKKMEPIGRWVKGKWEKDAKHVAFSAPETSDQKLARELVAKDAALSAALMELEAIKAEQAKKEQAAKDAVERARLAALTKDKDKGQGA